MSMEAVRTRALFWTAFQENFSPVSRLFNAARLPTQPLPPNWGTPVSWLVERNGTSLSLRSRFSLHLHAR